MVACSSCASDAPLVVIVECMSELSRSSEIGLESVLLSCSTYARSSLIVHDSISARGKLAIGCVRSRHVVNRSSLSCLPTDPVLHVWRCPLCVDFLEKAGAAAEICGVCVQSM